MDLAVAWPIETKLFFHLGMAAGREMMTGDNGGRAEARRSEPFGQPSNTWMAAERCGGAGDPWNALNKQTDASTGWSHHGARSLAPQSGRGLSPEPEVVYDIVSIATEPFTLPRDAKPDFWSDRVERDLTVLDYAAQAEHDVQQASEQASGVWRIPRSTSITARVVASAGAFLAALSSAGLCWAAMGRGQATCLSYPENVRPALYDTGQVQLFASPDGSWLLLDDGLGRLVGWQSQPASAPIWFASYQARPKLVTNYGGAYLFERQLGRLVRKAGGQLGVVTRVDLRSGRESLFRRPELMRSDPWLIGGRAGSIDAHGRFVAIAGRRYGREEGTWVLDDCLMQELYEKEPPFKHNCGSVLEIAGEGVDEEWPGSVWIPAAPRVRIEAALVMDGMLVTDEKSEDGGTRAIVVRQLRGLKEIRRWTPPPKPMIHAGGLVVFVEAQGKSGDRPPMSELQVFDLLSGKELKRVSVGCEDCSMPDGCDAVTEGASGAPFVVIGKQCSDKPDSWWTVSVETGDVSWRAVAARETNWVTPTAGAVWSVEERGVCRYPLRAATVTSEPSKTSRSVRGSKTSGQRPAGPAHR